MDLVSHINKIFIRRNMCLNIIKHKQNMGNLRECELCMTLYCTKFGNYTKDDLKSAYRDLQEGNNPRKLYVFFKNSNIVTPELQKFKDDFVKDFGHFFCKFENVDTMRLEFLLQLEAYQNNISEKLLKVENQKVLMEGVTVVDLNNVPFVSMNKEFVRLRDGINKTNQRIERCRKRLNENKNDEDSQVELSEYLTEREKTQKEFDKYQEDLFDLARKVSSLSTQRISERSAEAIMLFNEGDAAGANTILNTEDLIRDKETNFKEYDEHINLAEQAFERIKLNYHEWRLKGHTVLVDEAKSIVDRIAEADNAYIQAIDCAKKLKYDIDNKEKYASVIYEYARFSCSYSMCDKAILLYIEFIKLCSSIYGDRSDEILSAYNNISYALSISGRIKESIKYSYKVLNIDSNNAIICMATYNNLGCCYRELGKYDRALRYLFRASLYSNCQTSEENINLGSIKSNIGEVFYRKCDYDQALNYYYESLSIRKRYLNKDHVDIGVTFCNIGLAYHDKGDDEQALKYLYLGLEIHEQNYGTRHICTATNYDNLGIVYLSKKDYATALDYHKKALEIRENNGARRSDIAKSYNNIGCVHRDQGLYLKAIDYLNKALDIEEDIYDNNHLQLAITYENMSLSYYLQNMLPQALNFYSKALEIRTNVQGKDHHLTKVTRSNFDYIRKIIGLCTPQPQ